MLNLPLKMIGLFYFDTNTAG